MINTADLPPVPSVQFFHELEVTRTQALIDRNIELARQLHAPEYQLVTPAGRTFSRDSYLEKIETGTLQYRKWEIAALSVRACAVMAITRYRASLQFESGNVLDCWHIDSYELRGARWQAVWSQATAIAASVERAA